MSEVTEFLLARIAEDEAEVGGLYPGERDENAGPNGIGWADVGAINEVLMTSANRVLAECKAKRHIIWGMTPYGTLDDINAREIFGILASVYADHPDYDPAWS